MDKIFCAPGSAAIAELAECVAINPDQIDRLADFAEKEHIDLTVVGPELPLTLGIADLFESRRPENFRTESSRRPTRRQQSLRQRNSSRQRNSHGSIRHLHRRRHGKAVLGAAKITLRHQSRRSRRRQRRADLRDLGGSRGRHRGNPRAKVVRRRRRQSRHRRISRR